MKSLSSILLLAIPVLANLALNIEKRQSPVSATEFVDVRCGLPSGYSFTSDPKLPDPFTFANGTKVKSKADWPCRRQEINDLFQKYELGTKPIPKAGAVQEAFQPENYPSLSLKEGNPSPSLQQSRRQPAELLHTQQSLVSEESASPSQRASEASPLATTRWPHSRTALPMARGNSSTCTAAP
jgi:hypothetical protein